MEEKNDINCSNNVEGEQCDACKLGLFGFPECLNGIFDFLRNCIS